MKFKTHQLALVAATMLALASCSAPKEVTYFRDIVPGQEAVILNPSPIKLQANDKLAIVVSTSDPRLNALFNLPVTTNRLGHLVSDGGGMSSNQTDGTVTPYTIDRQGFITFPVLGKLHVAGMTREELAEYIRRELISRDLVKNPIVTVDYLNLSVSVMGEVARPGRFPISREDYTILDALSAAGDITIFGKRHNILVLREENGMQKSYTIDLNSGKDLTKSPVYYLQQNDVIYVEPNSTKARQSTPDGNVWSQPSLWISVASLLTTISVLIVNSSK